MYLVSCGLSFRSRLDTQLMHLLVPLALLAHDWPTFEKDRAKPVETGGRGSRC